MDLFRLVSVIPLLMMLPEVRHESRVLCFGLYIGKEVYIGCLVPAFSSNLNNRPDFGGRWGFFGGAPDNCQ